MKKAFEVACSSLTIGGSEGKQRRAKKGKRESGSERGWRGL